MYIVAHASKLDLGSGSFFCVTVYNEDRTFEGDTPPNMLQLGCLAHFSMYLWAMSGPWTSPSGKPLTSQLRILFSSAETVMPSSFHPKEPLLVKPPWPYVFLRSPHLSEVKSQSLPWPRANGLGRRSKLCDADLH